MAERTNIDLTYLGPSDSGKAWQFEDEDGGKIWLPDSQIVFDYMAREGDSVDVEIPEWLAIDKGLI